MEIKGLIFDMDGLMIDTEKLLQKFWVQAARELGYPMELEHTLQIRSLSAEFADAKLKGIFGDSFDYYAVRDRRRELMREHVSKYGVEEKPGLGELLDYAKQKEYRLGVATATDAQRTEQYLNCIGKYTYFDAFVCGSMVKKGKPEPDVYLEAARQLGLNPQECIALEDSPNGILAAYRAGCVPIMVPDLDQPDEETMGLLCGKVDTLQDVIPLLERICV